MGIGEEDGFEFNGLVEFELEGLIEERGRGLDLSDGFFLILRDGVGINFEDFLVIFFKMDEVLNGLCRFLDNFGDLVEFEDELVIGCKVVDDFFEEDDAIEIDIGEVLRFLEEWVEIDLEDGVVEELRGFGDGGEGARGGEGYWEEEEEECEIFLIFFQFRF